MSKEPKEVYDFLQQLVRSSQAWDSFELKKNLTIGKEGTSAMGREKYIVSEKHDTSVRLATLAKRVEVMEEKKQSLKVCLTLMKSFVQFMIAAHT